MQQKHQFGLDTIPLTKISESATGAKALFSGSKEEHDFMMTSTVYLKKVIFPNYFLSKNALSLREGTHINPYKHTVLFVGHMQTVQTQIRRQRTFCGV